MTAEIINLRRARKAKQRQVAADEASENRLKFGRTRHERETERAKQSLDERRLDALRRDVDKPET